MVETEHVLAIVAIILLLLSVYVYNGGKMITMRGEKYYATRNAVGASILKVN